MRDTPRNLARSEGKSYYFSGFPCVNGHETKRFVSDGKCYQCLLDKQHRRRKEATARRPPRPDPAIARRLTKARYKRKHAAKVSASSLEYNRRNRARINEREAVNKRRRYEADPNYKLKCIVRSRLAKAMDGFQKPESTLDGLGCTLAEFRAYLESKFRPGMDWSNVGKVWQIDHVRPLGLFDLTDRNQFLQACHYTNHQPLFVEEHKIKTSDDRRAIREHRQGVLA